MSSILVIGCLSFDTIHLKQSMPETHETIGGAGLYTALAAAHAGADVTLCAPRIVSEGNRRFVGEKLYSTLKSVHEKINWIGPLVEVEEMPALEIEHLGAGRANLVSARWGAESRLQPDHMPDDLEFDIIHIAALSSAKRQLSFAEAIADRQEARKLRKPTLSIGTYANCIREDIDTVRRLLEISNLFFMNRNECTLLYGALPVIPAKDQLIFVTDAASDAFLYTASGAIMFDSAKAEERDPTGAGDTFCGATLAGIASGQNPETSARNAMQLAAQGIEYPGPEFFTRNPV